MTNDSISPELQQLPLQVHTHELGLSGLWLGQTHRFGEGATDQFPFNLAAHVGDDAELVNRRRMRIEEAIGAPVVWLNQVHGALCVKAQTDCNYPASADASWTDKSNMALAVMTADCLPVVLALADESGQAVRVGVAHAGWRGLLEGVLQNCAITLRSGIALSNPTVHAWLGPAIGPESFEVGPEVREAFLARVSSTGTIQRAEQWSACFMPSDHRNGAWMADLYRLAQLALAEVGVDTVRGGGMDTLTDEKWFSHRRSVRLGEPQGRMATIVRLLPGLAV